MSTNNCTHYKQDVHLSVYHQAKYCGGCGHWLLPRCSSPTCVYCMDRPRRAEVKRDEKVRQVGPIEGHP